MNLQQIIKDQCERNRETLAKELTQYGGDENTGTMVKTCAVIDVNEKITKQTAEAVLQAVREWSKENRHSQVRWAVDAERLEEYLTQLEAKKE